MVPVMVWDPIERLLWGIALSFAFYCGIYYINKGRKREIFNEKIILFGFASILIGFGFTLLFTFFQILFVPGNLIDNTFRGDYELTGIPYEIFGKLSYVSLGLCGMFFMLSFDIIIKRTKYLPTIGFFVLVIMVILAPTQDFARTAYNFGITIGMIILVPIVLYLYTKWSRLEFKAFSAFLLFGYILLNIALNLAKKGHKELDFYPLSLSPSMFILACFFILFPSLFNPERISHHPLFIWISYAFIAVPILTIITILDIILEIYPYFIIIITGGTIYISILFYLVIRDIRSDISTKSQERKRDILELFTRPENVTEEDVIFHKERKICLVCKGKLSRSIYLCPECDAIYCKKCSSMLSTLENACWSCNAPFDPSKPVKPFEKIDKEPKIIGVKES
ncbi:MAG: hypothetical protein ACFE9Z_11155 [Promethearchaeota archaeon]